MIGLRLLLVLKNVYAAGCSYRHFHVAHGREVAGVVLWGCAAALLVLTFSMYAHGRAGRSALPALRFST